MPTRWRCRKKEFDTPKCFRLTYYNWWIRSSIKRFQDVNFINQSNLWMETNCKLNWPPIVLHALMYIIMQNTQRLTSATRPWASRVTKTTDRITFVFLLDKHMNHAILFTLMFRTDDHHFSFEISHKWVQVSLNVKREREK